jgi:hypothetical protein
MELAKGGDEMNKVTVGLLVAASLSIGFSMCASAQEKKSKFHLISKHNNGCIRVDPAPSGAIVAGLLRASPGCQNPKSPDRLIAIGTNAPHTFVFDLGGGEVRCFNVRPIDTRTIPSDIFANKCTPPTSHWGIGLPDADGFTTISLFEGEAFCLSVGEINGHVMVDKCSDTNRRQRWKVEEVTLP